MLSGAGQDPKYGTPVFHPPLSPVNRSNAAFSLACLYDGTYHEAGTLDDANTDHAKAFVLYVAAAIILRKLQVHTMISLLYVAFC